MDMSCSYKAYACFFFVEPDLIWVDVHLAFHEGFSLPFIFNSWCLSGFTTQLVLLYWVGIFFYKIFHLFLLSMDAYAGFFLSIFYLFLFRGCRAQPFLNCLVFLIFYSRNVVYIEWK